jgi:hypothetical protein
MSELDIVLPDEPPLSYPSPPEELQEALELYSPLPQTFRVYNDTDYASAGEALKNRLRMKKLIVDFFAPLKAAAHEAHKRLTLAEKEKLGPINMDEIYLKRAMGLYKAEADAAAAKARAEAEAVLRKQAEDRQLEEAARLEAAGQKKAAEAVLAAPTIVPMPAPVAAAPVVEGVSFSTTWKAEVTDLRALVLAVAANYDAYGHLLIANDSTLNSFARSTKGNVNLPGVRIFAETGVRGRA